MALLLAHFLFAQSAARAKKLAGPRALGLIEITPSGKVTLLPVTIMIDGEFYDASAYKAAPVPLALYADTVYEGVKSGVSQGLFTVTTAQRGETTWRGLGKWQSAADISADETRKKAAEAKAAKPKEDADGPPVLKRPAAESPQKAAQASSPPPPTTVTQAGTPAAGSPAPAPAPQTPPPPPSATTPVPARQPEAKAPDHDPNLPTLRRGKVAAAQEERSLDSVGDAAKSGAPAGSRAPSSTAPGSTGPGSATLSAAASRAATATSGILYIPAISDASGPEPRPYAYSMKADEEAKFRNKILALAALEVGARAKDLGLATAAAAPVRSSPAAPATARSAAGSSRRSSKAAKPPGPTFDDVQLRVFDLSNSNEPILVLTASARLPPSSKTTGTADFEYLVTVVAREDIYGDLHRAFSNVTDTRHLDVLPRVEFIDAVDADGDGRGELLFRQVSDAGRAFSLYRVIGDQLWPLFQGKLGQ